MNQETQSSQTNPQERPLVLIVEDEVALAHVISGALRSRGFDVLFAQGSGEAIDLYRRRGEEIALVLSDVVMPPTNGAQLLRMLKDIDPDVKLVFMSGQAIEDALPETPKEDYCGWLQKPFSLKELVNTLRAAMKGNMAD